MLCVITPKSGLALIAASALAIDNLTGSVQYWTLTPSGGVPSSASLASPFGRSERRRPVRRP